MSWDPTRRVFLKGAGLAALGVGIGPSPLLVRAAEAASSGPAVLVHIFLRGGADGLNLLVPHGDPEYYDLRGPLALPRPGEPDGVVALDDHFGLHPVMAGLAPLYRDGRLAFLHAVGNYDVSRSHFSAQDFVEMGTPGVRSTTTGTLSRVAAGFAEKGTTKVVSFSSQRPVSLLGPEDALVTLDLAAYRLRARGWEAEAERQIQAMYTGTPLERLTGGIFDAARILSRTLAPETTPAQGAAYPDSPLAGSLRQVADIIRAGIGTRCVFVHGRGNFDTHAGQLEANRTDYAILADALVAFDRDLGRKMDDVVVLVTTEFGRTVFANGSLGTDHGSGYCAMILGGRVKGGRVHGRWPGLAKSQLFEERDLGVTTDFRELFADVAKNHLRIADAGALFPGYAPSGALSLWS